MSREKDVEAIRRLALRLKPDYCSVDGACIYHAEAARLYLARVYGNNDVIVQAGSASWPRVRPEQDDGVSATHFSYVFEWNLEARWRIARGELPELHAWCYDRRTKCFIDVTVGFQVEACRRTANMDWPGDPPPDFIWHREDFLREKVILYRCEFQALNIALAGIRDTVNQAERDRFLKEGRA